MVTLTRPIHMLFVEPIVAALSIYVAFNFATVYSFFVAFPFVFAEVYNFTPEQSGLTFPLSKTPSKVSTRSHETDGAGNAALLHHDR
jgi:hypothetical protein